MSTAKKDVIAELERQQREKEEAAPFVQVVEDLTKSSNSMCLEEKKVAAHMADAFSRQHRTLQQSVMRVLAEFISKVGETPMEFTDLRNEGAISWARDVKNIQQSMPFI